jgi:hypothetical protein
LACIRPKLNQCEHAIAKVASPLAFLH